MYPDEGQIFRAASMENPSSAAKSTRRPLIFFVHFLGGHKRVMKRHIEFVNELGFDAYVFNLNDELKDHYYVPYSHRSKKFGLKHALADQIENHLDLFSEYAEKIIFGFSNVAAAAIEVLARRASGDVAAMICDSGPGLDFFSASYNLLKHQFGVTNIPLRLARTPIVALSWSPQLHKDLHDDLEKLPEGFPLLSIRGWRDQLISPKSIDQVFQPHKNLKWRKLNLPEAGHLNGLRDFPSEYKPEVEAFLKPFTEL